MYKIIGYYICELIPIPAFLNRDGTMLSVSECFGGIHPRMDICFFQNKYISQKEREDYRKRWKLSEKGTGELVANLSSLFGKGLYEDGRFVNLEVARYFYHSYFSGENCMLVSLSTKEKYFEILRKELTERYTDTDSLVTGAVDQNKLLGFDILGWDISSFHTFLCNQLQERLSGVRFNTYGLLDHTFDETAAFSDQIRGQGEPVVWLPCRLGKCI